MLCKQMTLPDGFRQRSPLVVADLPLNRRRLDHSSLRLQTEAALLGRLVSWQLIFFNMIIESSRKFRVSEKTCLRIFRLGKRAASVVDLGSEFILG